MVPMVGVEPTRCRQRRILSPLRLPIPSHRPVTVIIQERKSKRKRKIKKIFRLALYIFLFLYF